MKHRCNRPPKHVAAVIAFLQRIGASVSEVVTAHCHRVLFTLSGSRFCLGVRLTHDASDAVRRARSGLHRMLRRAGLPLPVAA